MNEYEKIAAKLAEFAEKLDLKGHKKIAEEVDELNSKIIASIDLMEYEKVVPAIMKPVGFELRTNAGFEVVESIEELHSKLNSNSTSSINIVSGIKDALFAQECFDGLATLKTTASKDTLNVAISLALRHGLIK